ncbi:MAG: PIN domain-containing protein [Candidatus Kerfeldbacteria bacterium]|nr:PIN domain-containing protein [Candidatus Kerfeldbacteria bacterium]
MAKIAAFKRVLSKHKNIGVDASIFIYQFEQHPQFEPLCSVIFELLTREKIFITASSLLVSEVFVQPFMKKDIETIALYEQVFSALPQFSLIDVDYAVAKIAAQIRAEYRILLPDALHLACSIRSGASLFITNDRALKKVKDIQVVCLKDYL